MSLSAVNYSRVINGDRYIPPGSPGRLGEPAERSVVRFGLGTERRMGKGASTNQRLIPPETRVSINEKPRKKAHETMDIVRGP